VVTGAGESPKSATFVYTKPPVITSIKPDVGEPAGKVHIELSGKHFRTASAATIGGVEVTPAVESDTKILLEVPPMDAGTYDVDVTNVVGSSVPNQDSRYTYAASEPWQLVDNVPGTGEDSTNFVGADCRSGICYAVGGKTADLSAHESEPFIDYEQDNGDWAQATVTPSDSGALHDAYLRQVSCSADNTCIALGNDTDWSGSDPVVLPLAAVGSGQSWTTFHPPMPSDWHPDRRQPLTDAACDAGKCAVVGWFGVGTTKRLVVATYSDGTWTDRSPSAALHGAGTNVFDNLVITCPSASRCLAVGRDGRRQPIAVDIPLTGTADATVQNLSVQLSDPHNNVTMNGIDCSTATSCVAVGYDFDLPSDPDADFGPPHAFFERYEDGTWTYHRFALPASIAAHHTTGVRWHYPSVSCVAGGTCYVAGALDVTWKSSRGTQWKYAGTITRITDSGQHSVFAAVLDPYANESALGPIFCGQQPTCVAFGYQGTPPLDGDGPPTDVRQFTVHVGTKDRPRIYENPTIDGARSDYSAVSCATPDHCIAVGTHIVTDEHGVTTHTDAWIQES
jgi:hypothetical protein